MPISVTILSELATVYVRYSGHVQISEGIQGFINYTQDPDYRPGQKQFVDMRDVTSVEPDHTAVMKLQALKAEYFLQPDCQTMVCFLAPTPIAREMAAMAMRSWVGMDHIVIRMIEDEDAALDFLGLPARDIASLLGEKT